jgi:Tol biopolymer transport system component
MKVNTVFSTAFFVAGIAAINTVAAAPDVIVKYIPTESSATIAPTVSADGRYIVHKLGHKGTNSVDILIYDVASDIEIQANLKVTGGVPSGAVCDTPTISANGLYAAFACRAAEMGSVATAGTAYFVYNRLADKTEMVPDMGRDGAVATYYTGLSPDGRYLAFRTLNAGVTKLFIRDLVNKTTATTTAKFLGGPVSSRISVSTDGRFITYAGRFDSTNAANDVLVYDNLTGITETENLKFDGTHSVNGVQEPSASDDASFISFASNDIRLVNPAGPSGMSVYIRDRTTGTTEIISRTLTNVAMNSISGNGRYVAYLNGSISVYDRWTKTTRNIVTTGLTNATFPRISTDGRYVVFGGISGGAQTIVIADMGIAPGVALSANTLTLTEGGIAATYTAVLTQAPSSDVTVTIAPDKQLSLARTQLTFTPQNWNVPQAVSVQAIQDSIAEGVHSGKITNSVTSADIQYSVVRPLTVIATISDAIVPTLLLPGATWNQTDLPLTGTAAPGATVMLTATNRNTGWFTSVSAVADAQGHWNYTLTGLSDGVIDFDVQADGVHGVPQTTTVTLPAK